MHALTSSGLSVASQVPLALDYDGIRIPCAYRADLIVNDELIVELKCATQIHSVHRWQVLTYLRLAKLSQGLLINFHVEHLRDGIISVLNGRV